MWLHGALERVVGSRSQRGTYEVDKKERQMGRAHGEKKQVRVRF